MNSQMSARDAAAEVIRLKKAYESQSKGVEGFHNSNTAKQLSSQAEQLRVQYGLDDSKFGSGATLADAYMNFHNDFGQQSSPQQNQRPQAPQQQMPQQAPQDNYSQSDARLEEILNMLQQSSQSSFESQKAQLDSVLEQQLADLESQLAEAVQSGEMSVRDANDAFESQKAEIERMAYQQSQATKAYGGHLGIQNSPASIAMQQGDNARSNRLQNANMSDRDRRIADVRDRINLVKQQKGIAERTARAEHGYALSSAQAQSNQQFMQSASQLLGQDYMARMGFEHDERMFDKSAQHDYNMSDREQSNRMEIIRAEFENRIGEATHNSRLRLVEMAQAQDYRVDEIGLMFENDMVKLATQAGYEKELQAMRNSGQMAAVNAQINAQIAAENRAAQRAQEELARLVDPNSNEYKLAELEIKRSVDANVEGIYATAAANMQTEMILGNPNLPKYGEEVEAPTDWSEGWGLVGKGINWISGYETKRENYDKQMTAVQELEQFMGTAPGTSGINLTPYANFIPSEREQNWNKTSESINRWLKKLP